MPKFLKIAENIYNKVECKNGFSNNILEDLNNIMIELRKEIKESDIKLVVNYIDFNELFTNSIKYYKLKIDLSILPDFKNKQEFILWLAGFVERITIGGREKYPPLDHKLYIFDKDIPPKLDDTSEDIINYFKNN
ncbi:hypothetical protein RFI02_00265 [Acinetobacter sichuanensis]|uniref:hypothetical protein n=1 Tax=Acinetobacter sichuanensis TaxID=2136183 RepID=UPI00280E5455|nr:hypothetical protein [Acinetobacter sichuanensis]MDQ9019547.1 hypothetical protein [Acinetobacter sichuanensis]